MGAPHTGWDSLVRESRASARRRGRRKGGRRQRQRLWLLTVVTTAVLGALALFVKAIARVPTAAPAALSASARTVSHGNASAAAHRVSPRGHQRSATAPVSGRPHVTDAASGLSYRLLPSPWRQGCPSDLNTPMFSWSAGENTVAANVTIGGDRGSLDRP